MFLTLQEAISEIQSGKLLSIAADESLLRQLPKGSWIGGTTPYFITDEGGIKSKDKLFVNVIDCAVEYKIITYTRDTILDIVNDTYQNGFTLLVLPFGSDPLNIYAAQAPNVEGIFMKSIAGWVTGFDLDVPGSSAKAVDGSTGTLYEDKAVALHVSIPAEKIAMIGIINIFRPSENSPEIRFLENGTSVEYCMIGNEKVLFADYLRNNAIDTKLPIIANYNGSNVNISIKEVSDDKVFLYAPVFTEQTYFFADRIGSYEEEFAQQLKNYTNVDPTYSCNCILNYLYGGLEGKKTPPFQGAVTFGEIAYQLLNQTLVYLEIL